MSRQKISPSSSLSGSINLARTCIWACVAAALAVWIAPGTSVAAQQDLGASSAVSPPSLPKVTELPKGYYRVAELADRGVFYAAGAPLFRIDDGNAHHGFAAIATWSKTGTNGPKRTQGMIYGVERGTITSAGYLIRQADLVASKSFHGLALRELPFPGAHYMTIDLIKGATPDSNQYLWLWHFVPQQGQARPMLPAGKLAPVTSLPQTFSVTACDTFPKSFCPQMGRHHRDLSTSGRRLPDAIGDDSVWYGEAAGKLVFIEYIFKQEDFAAGSTWSAIPLDGLPIPPIDNVHILHYNGTPGTFTAHMYFIPEQTYLAWVTEPPSL
jgi:hypothetical protein